MEGIAIPDLVTRTRLHRAFNSRLRAMCDRAGFRFIEVFDILLGPDGTVDRRFIAVSRGQDHHLDDEPMHGLTREIVESAVRQAGSDSTRRPVRWRLLRSFAGCLAAEGAERRTAAARRREERKARGAGDT